MFLTPRFSYRCLKLAVTARAWTSAGAHTGYGQGGYSGWVYGWVYREGYTGEYYPATARGQPQVQRSGPRNPPAGRVEWVVPGAGTRVLGCSAAGRALYHPSGPVRHPGALPVQDPQNAASGPITARFSLKYCKVSQYRGVSPKYVEKASHAPYFQNGLQKSPLVILGFPFSPAFSPKELLGLF